MSEVNAALCLTRLVESGKSLVPCFFRPSVYSRPFFYNVNKYFLKQQFIHNLMPTDQKQQKP